MKNKKKDHKPRWHKTNQMYHRKPKNEPNLSYKSKMRHYKMKPGRRKPN